RIGGVAGSQEKRATLTPALHDSPFDDHGAPPVSQVEAPSRRRQDRPILSYEAFGELFVHDHLAPRRLRGTGARLGNRSAQEYGSGGRTGRGGARTNSSH